jgi:hypothetical protein
VRTARRGVVADREDNPRRAAVQLLAMLILTGALLAAPFVYFWLRIDAARRPPAERAAAIEHSNCAQLRAHLQAEEAEAGSATFDLLSRRAETERLIVRRGEQLHCRPAIRFPTRPAYD